MSRAFETHWPEYLIEAALLGMFMLAACAAVCLFEHPSSVIRRRFPSGRLRRTMVGILMGLTGIALIYSPLGQRSGAHMNPATTLTFLALGKIGMWDAVFYVLAQFVGGLAGVGLAGLVLRGIVDHPAVRFVITVPGQAGVRGQLAAWAGEFAIAFLMMGMVLVSANHMGTSPYTGLFAGFLLAMYIAIEAPLSGMSLNPARTLASAIAAREFRGLWIYFTAPPLAMLAAAGVYASVEGRLGVYCAKLCHPDHGDCMFECRINHMGHPTDGVDSQPSGRIGIQRVSTSESGDKSETRR
ncbi:MAG: Aquaporin Z [Phycisphaerales bacterium]|nr:Aquaporin Z [Phycisphaerales bacterium]